MKQITKRHLTLLGLAFAAWVCNGDIGVNSNEFLMATADARLGRPATPVSYAGVARRTTVRVATPGVGHQALECVQALEPGKLEWATVVGSVLILADQ